MRKLLSFKKLAVWIEDDGSEVGLKQTYQYGVRLPDGVEVWSDDVDGPQIHVLGRNVWVGEGPAEDQKISGYTPISLERAQEIYEADLTARGIPSPHGYRLVRIRRPIQIIVNPAESAPYPVGATDAE